MPPLRRFRRIVVCGLISPYNDTELRPGPSLVPLLTSRVTIRGFIVSDHFDRLPDFLKDMSQWYRDGKITDEETVVEGIEKVPRAFMGLFKGGNRGNMQVME